MFGWEFSGVFTNSGVGYLRSIDGQLIDWMFEDFSSGTAAPIVAAIDGDDIPDIVVSHPLASMSVICAASGGTVCATASLSHDAVSIELWPDDDGAPRIVYSTLQEGAWMGRIISNPECP